MVEKIQGINASEIIIDVEKDDIDCFHVFIETTNSISELSVSKPFLHRVAGCLLW